MSSFKFFVASGALACLLPLSAARADDLTALRAELEALKSDYSQKVSALEERITQLEAAGVVAQNAPPVPEPPPTPSPAQPVARGASAFNPAISVILAGNYAHLSQDPETWHIAGFMPNGGEIGPGERSFNLGESEITLSANVDPYFSANLTAAIDSEDSIGVEEAYVRTLALHDGFTVKAGRFFSGVGYLNEVHAHAWDFIDQPLVYQAFFDGQLGQDGAQVKWIAPTDLFIELGAETGNGQEFPGTRRNRNGLSGNALFAHLGGDVGNSTSWRAGLSWLDHRSDGREYDDSDDAGLPVLDAFTGKSRTWIVDATLKWAPNGNSMQRQLKLQGEYLHRKEDGTLAFDTEGANLSGDYSSKQSGWYLQSVYQFKPRWRFGARYDSLDSGSPRIGLVQNGFLPGEAFPALLTASPDRFTLMLDWSPSEFSRLRVQHAWDDSREAQRDHQFFLQYIFGIGAHGAHKF
jgi:hypothetical protein